jgi:predicted nuclease of restriction endonuclease-like (RecB) superfamily
MEIDRRNILFKKVSQLLHESRCQVIRSINTAMVYTYFEIGKLIIEEQQHGKDRAKYGKSVLKNLSEKLTEEVGSGFSVDNLENMRRFYLTYSNSETVSRNLKSPDFQLSWSHYLKLMRIDNPEERRFYEINPTS